MTAARRHAPGAMASEAVSLTSRMPAVEEAPIMLVGEQRGCLLERHPARVVDLVRRSEAAPGRGHLPVADGLGPSLGITVGGGPDLPAQPAAQPRLLFDLAQRRLGLGLARVELAFGNDQSSYAGR